MRIGELFGEPSVAGQKSEQDVSARSCWHPKEWATRFRTQLTSGRSEGDVAGQDAARRASLGRAARAQRTGRSTHEYRTG